MTKRGDVVIIDFPFTDLPQSKPRPALVIQNDRDN
jgi:mRNA-degrading endonuclease toxin of MazEF toxin-antitoxin module